MADQRDTWLHEAFATYALDSHIYKAEVTPYHCYGATAHGGFLVSMMLSAVREHFGSTLRSCQQPHTFNAQLMILRPTTAGEVILKIEDLKLGASFSTVRITITQKDKACITGQFSNMDMLAEKGLSLSTDYRLKPAPASADIRKLADDTDPNWHGWTYSPDHESFKAFLHVRFFFPVAGVAHPSISEQWFTPVRKEDVFTTEMLGFIADHWHRMTENYRSKAPWGTKDVASRAARGYSGDVSARNDGGENHGFYAYPTLSMSLEIKKLLPAEGVKWLYVRAEAKQIKNGRLDAEIVILDENMELVALSHQVSSIIDLDLASKEGWQLKKGKL